MANKILNTRVISRRDSSSNWVSSNPVLLNGERILVDFYDSGTYKYSREKIGDGVKTYNQLPFMDEGFKVPIGPHSHPVTTSDDGVILLSSEVTSDGGHKITAEHVNYYDDLKNIGDGDFVTTPSMLISEEGHVIDVHDDPVNYIGGGAIDVSVNKQQGCYDVSMSHEKMYGKTYTAKYLEGSYFLEDGHTNRVILKNKYIRENTLCFSNLNINLSYNDKYVYLYMDNTEYSTKILFDSNDYFHAEFSNGVILDSADIGNITFHEADIGKTFSLYFKEYIEIKHDGVGLYDNTTHIGPGQMKKLFIDRVKVSDEGHVLESDIDQITVTIPQAVIATDDSPSINVQHETNFSEPLLWRMKENNISVSHGNMYNMTDYNDYLTVYFGDDNLSVVGSDDTKSTAYEHWVGTAKEVPVSSIISDYNDHSNSKVIFSLLSYAQLDSRKIYYLQIDNDVYQASGDNLDFNCPYVKYDSINNNIVSINNISSLAGKKISLYTKLSPEVVYSQASTTDNAKDITITSESNEITIPHFSVERDGHVIRAENIKYKIEFPDVDVPDAISVITDDEPSIDVTTETKDGKISIDIQHGNMYDMPSGWTEAYTSSNFGGSKVSVAPGEKKSFTVPTVKVELDGHVVSAGNQEIEIEIPSKINYDAVDYLGVIYFDGDDYTQILQNAINNGAKNGDFFRVSNGGEVQDFYGGTIIIHSGDLLIANGDTLTTNITELLDPPSSDGKWGVIHCHNTDNISTGFKTELTVDSTNTKLIHKELDNTAVISTKEFKFAGSNHIAVSANSSTNTFTISDNISDLTSDEIKTMVASKFGVSV